MTWRTTCSAAATTASDELRRMRATAPPRLAITSGPPAAWLRASASRPAASATNSAYSVSRLTACWTRVCARYWLRVLSHEAANVDPPPTKEPTNPEVAEIIAGSISCASTSVRRWRLRASSAQRLSPPRAPRSYIAGWLTQHLHPGNAASPAGRLFLAALESLESLCDARHNNDANAGIAGESFQRRRECVAHLGGSHSSQEI